MSFTRLQKYICNPSFLFFFYKKKSWMHWNFVKCFFESIEIIDRFLASFHIMNNIDWFLNVKPCSWNKFYLVMIYYFYSTEFNLIFCKDFLCLYLWCILICSFFLFFYGTICLGFGIRIMLASSHELGNVPVLSCFWEYLCGNSVLSSLGM